MKKLRQLGASSLVLVSLSVLGIVQISNAAEAGQTQAPQSSEGRSRRPDRKSERPRINFAAAAAKLGTTEAKLKETLGIPVRAPQSNPQSNPQGESRGESRGDNSSGERGRPKRGHQEQGHGRPPRLDIKGAAAKLGVTEQKLMNALGLQPKPPQDQSGNMQQP